MGLITDELRNRFAEIGRQEDAENPIAVVKFFDIASVFKWYATEYNPEDNICFGYVHNVQDPIFSEWGYFSIDELESLRLGNTNIKMVERDALFSEQEVNKVIERVDAEINRAYGVEKELEVEQDNEHER